MDGYFDAITCAYLFHEIPPAVRDTVLHEAARVLKTDGLLLLADSLQLADAPTLRRHLEHFPEQFHEPFYRHYLKDDLRARLEAAGFEVVEAAAQFVTRSRLPENDSLRPCEGPLLTACQDNDATVGHVGPSPKPSGAPLPAGLPFWLTDRKSFQCVDSRRAEGHDHAEPDRKAGRAALRNSSRELYGLPARSASGCISRPCRSATARRKPPPGLREPRPISRGASAPGARRARAVAFRRSPLLLHIHRDVLLLHFE